MVITADVIFFPTKSAALSRNFRICRVVTSETDNLLASEPESATVKTTLESTSVGCAEPLQGVGSIPSYDLPT